MYSVVEKKLPEDRVKEYQDYIEEVLDFQNIFKKSEQELIELNTRFAEYYNLAMNSNVPVDEVKSSIGGWLQNAVFLSMGKKHNYSKYLKQIKAPTLIIHGEEDIIPVSSIRLYLDNIPNIELKTVPKAKHQPFNEQPQVFDKMVREAIGK